MYLPVFASFVAMVAVGWVRLRTRRQQHRAIARETAPDHEDGSASIASPAFAFADAVPVPLLILEKGGRLEFANRSAMLAFGDALGAIIRHPALQGLLNARDGAELTATRLELDVPVRRTLQARVSALTFGDVTRAQGFKARVIVALDDFTEVANVQRMQADFVAYASHELRTPLASIIGLLETIRGSAANDPVAQSDFLGLMRRQAARMNRLIDRLLHLSRAQTLEHWRPETPLSLRAFWERLQEEVVSLGQRYGQEVRQPLTVPDATVRGDQDQLTQMMLNLVENALKYAGEGSRTQLFVERDARGGVLLGVEDDGPGVEPRHLPRLTERFYRVNQGATAGTGLGLAIVKHIVDRHSGRLRITSDTGKGLRCEIWLPPESSACDTDGNRAQ